MRTAKRLFEQLTDADHLDRAATLTVRGKRRRRDVAWLLFRREEVLERLRRELIDGTYAPRGFELVVIREPKRRVIARAPIEDRVVHAALVLAMEPVWARSLLPEDMACRRGHGTHRAVLRLVEAMRRHRFALHLDIKSYFPSVDLDLLRSLVRRRIRDERFTEVLDRVIDAGRGVYDQADVRAAARLGPEWPPPGRGLPIGAYTSQFLATHVYLTALDHHVKRAMKVPAYTRYVDDLFLFGDRREDLLRWRTEVACYLREHRRLRLKHPFARVLSCYGHLDALGYKVTRDGAEALPRATARLRRRVAAELGRPRGRPVRVDMRRSVASTAGIVLFG